MSSSLSLTRRTVSENHTKGLRQSDGELQYDLSPYPTRRQ